MAYPALRGGRSPGAVRGSGELAQRNRPGTSGPASRGWQSLGSPRFTTLTLLGSGGREVLRRPARDPAHRVRNPVDLRGPPPSGQTASPLQRRGCPPVGSDRSLDRVFAGCEESREEAMEGAAPHATGRAGLFLAGLGAGCVPAGAVVTLSGTRPDTLLVDRSATTGGSNRGLGREPGARRARGNEVPCRPPGSPPPEASRYHGAP